MAGDRCCCQKPLAEKRWLGGWVEKTFGSEKLRWENLWLREVGGTKKMESGWHAVQGGPVSLDTARLLRAAGGLLETAGTVEFGWQAMQRGAVSLDTARLLRALGFRVRQHRLAPKSKPTNDFCTKSK